MNTAWTTAPLRELLTKSDNWIVLDAEREYKEVTVRLWGRGVALRGIVSGSTVAGTRRMQVKAGEFIASRIDARNGAFGLIPEELDGAVVTNDFPVFSVNEERVLSSYLNWLSKTNDFVEACKAASEGTTNRVRLKEDRFLQIEIPLPPLTEQRRIVAKIARLAGKIEEARGLREQVERDAHRLLASTYEKIVDGAPNKPLQEVAPLNRRPVVIEPDGVYPQVSVRSFGKGTFHNPPVKGSDLTWQKPYWVEANDILISNIKAWEGAIAVAKPEDDGRVASHRYLTCVPIPGKATARFVSFHLLTPDGLSLIGDASPGTADRNRTLSTKLLQRIPVPVPPYRQQLEFDRLCIYVEELKAIQTQSVAELDALLPAILDRAFKGAL